METLCPGQILTATFEDGSTLKYHGCAIPRCPHIHWYDRARLQLYHNKLEAAAEAAALERGPVIPTYLLTFTYNARSGTKLEWFNLLCKQLESKLFLTWVACVEHIDRNIHSHVLVTTKHANLSQQRFTSFTKKHRLDIRKVSLNNGIETYQTKENPTFVESKGFREYYENEILKNEKT
nr:MAG TPA: hypothetical protein [Cressdnaviricota sp.]